MKRNWRLSRNSDLIEGQLNRILDRHICYKDSPSPPAAPNYAAAAQAQGIANLETAQAQGRINNPNIYTPYGSQTVTWGGGEPQFNQSAYDQAMGQYNSALNQYNSGGQQYLGTNPDTMQPIYGPGPSGTAPVIPTREQFTTSGPADQPTLTQTLAPAQQQLLDAQNRISSNLAGVAESGINRVSQGMGQPFDMSQVNPVQTSSGVNPNYTSSVGYTPLQSSYDQGGNVQYGNGFNGQIQNSFNQGGPLQSSTGYNGHIQNSFNQGGPLQSSTGYNGQVQGQINTNGIAPIPIVDAQARQHAEDLAYQAATSRLDPQWAQRNAMQDTQLRNQGLVAGGEAYDAAKRDQGYQQNDAYLQAQANAVNQGLTNQQAQFNMGLAANQTGFGQAQNMGQFANTAQAQGYGQALNNANLYNAAQGQQFSQGLGAMNAANAAQQQGYGQALNNANLNNATQAQLYNQNLGAAQFGNTAQQQGFGQAQTTQQAYNAAQAQANAQNQQQAAFGNQAALSNYGMGLQNAQLGNQVGQQQFQQGLANANLGNAASQQQIQQQAYLRSLPLNELNALRTGAQVQNPQFQQYQGANIGQTPVFQAAQAQAGAAQNQYNAQMGANNAFNSGLFQLGAAAVPFIL